MTFSNIFPKEILEISNIFNDSGFEISLVGGSVRDIFLKREISDWDLTTSAMPDDIEKILSKYAYDVWTIGKKFGTIGCNKNNIKVEITTYRSDIYNDETRKPVVKFGDNLIDDLKRRDFTINAIALELPSMKIIDPFGGLSDINSKLIKTPSSP